MNTSVSESDPTPLPMPKPNPKSKPNRRPAGPERRERYRISSGQVEAVFDRKHRVRLLDVSDRGVCIESTTPLPFSADTTLILDDARDRPVRVATVWSRLTATGDGQRYRAGLELLEPSFEQIQMLLDLATE